MDPGSHSKQGESQITHPDHSLMLKPVLPLPLSHGNAAGSLATPLKVTFEGLQAVSR